MIWTKPPWNYVPAVNLQGCTPTTTDIAANGRPSQKEKALIFLNTVSGDMDIYQKVFFSLHGTVSGIPMALVEEAESLQKKY